jgi:microcystin-dependent protein
MSQPYVGEIRMFGGNFAPAGWAFCAGQLMPISENETLFNLIGTTYGGDGQSTFGLPDLRGRAPMHAGTALGTTVTLAQTGGVEGVTLATAQIPQHNHMFQATTTGAALSPQNAVAAIPSSTSAPGLQTYAAAGGAPLVPLKPTMIQNNGGGQPHENRQPFLCVSFIISLFGIFPTPT